MDDLSDDDRNDRIASGNAVGEFQSRSLQNSLKRQQGEQQQSFPSSFSSSPSSSSSSSSSSSNNRRRLLKKSKKSSRSIGYGLPVEEDPPLSASSRPLSPAQSKRYSRPRPRSSSGGQKSSSVSARSNDSSSPASTTVMGNNIHRPSSSSSSSSSSSATPSPQEADPEKQPNPAAAASVINQLPLDQIPQPPSHDRSSAARQAAKSRRAEAHTAWIQHLERVGGRREALDRSQCQSTHDRWLGTPITDREEEHLCREGLPLPPRGRVKAVLFDLDLTILSIHTRGRWDHPVQELVPFVNRCFIHLVPRLLAEGFRLGIVTFGDVLLVRPDSKALAGDALVTALLRETFYHHFWCDEGRSHQESLRRAQEITEEFLIVCANPNRRNFLARKEGRPNDVIPASKRSHIEEVQRMIQRRNWTPIRNEEIILFDDDGRNIQAEQDTGVIGFHVDFHTGLRGAAWIKAMETLYQKQEQQEEQEQEQQEQNNL